MKSKQTAIRVFPFSSSFATFVVKFRLLSTGFCLLNSDYYKEVTHV
jgi:hypothetical protein